MEQHSHNSDFKKKLPGFLTSVPLVPCLAAFGLIYLLVSLFTGGGKAPASRNPAQDSQVVLESDVRQLPQPEQTGTADPAVSDPAATVPDTSAAPDSRMTDAPTETPATEPPTEAPTTEPPTEAPTTEPPTERPTEPPSQDGRVIYLTFDDGPGKNTRTVMSILKQYDVPATFFTVGYFVTVWPETTAEIVSNGNLIACHSYSHEYDQCYASANAFMNEVDKWKDAVRATGAELPDRICVRFPGGSTTPNAKDVVDDIKYLLKQGGYRWFDWNAGDNDKYPRGNIHNLPDEEYFWASYQENIGWYANDPNASVVMLLHDSEKGTVAILPRMIEDLKRQGYRFDTLDHHPKWDQ